MIDKETIIAGRTRTQKPELEFKASGRVIAPPKKVSDWVGCLVRSKFETSTQLATFKPGTIFIIKSSGLTKVLETLPCECCGIRATMRVVENADAFMKQFEFLDKDGGRYRRPQRRGFVDS